MNDKKPTIGELCREITKAAEETPPVLVLISAFIGLGAAVLYSYRSVWTLAVACLSLSAGDAWGRGMGLLVAGVLMAATAAVWASPKREK